jgi:predicted DsbA family dithiol-disulfide isomerase
MPRTKKTVQPVESKVEAPKTEAVKMRKPYPGHAERIEMAEQKNARLEKLNADRIQLVEKTENKLNERKEALLKSTQELEAAIGLRNRLIASKDRPVGSAATKAVKAAEKAQFDELKAKLEAQGKTVEDLLKELG